jgi:hypothetical protein
MDVDRLHCPRCNSLNTKRAPAFAQPRRPSLVRGCLLMFLIWIVVIVLIVVFMALARRFLFHGSEPEIFGKIVGLLPTLSGLVILAVGLVRWVQKRNRHQLLISEQLDTCSCSDCGHSWT